MTNFEIMRHAATIARKTTCWIGIGTVISKDGKILAEAWNETLPGEECCQAYRERAAAHRPHHGNEGCIRHDLGLSQGREIEKVCSIHAEVNAIARAAEQGISIRGATIFVTSFPCIICLRSIVVTGIKRIVYMNDFYKPHSLEMLQKNKIEIKQIAEKEVWRKLLSSRANLS